MGYLHRIERVSVSHLIQLLHGLDSLDNTAPPSAIATNYVQSNKPSDPRDMLDQGLGSTYQSYDDAIVIPSELLDQKYPRVEA